MKKNLIRRCLITLGLLLFFTVVMPCIPNYTTKALASDTGNKKSDNYRLNLDDIKIPKGQSRTLRVYNVGEKAKIYFKSSDKEIASVDDGVITANKVGEAVITATIKEGSDSTSLSCKVTVGPAAVSVKFTQSIVILSQDSVESLEAVLKPGNTVEDAKYKSLDSSIASVTPGGRVTAKKYGYAEVRAYIAATDSDGSQKYDACSVLVVSNDHVSKLNKYFNDHSELNSVSNSALRDALDRFFNKEYDPSSSSSSLISSLNRYLHRVLDID